MWEGEWALLQLGVRENSPWPALNRVPSVGGWVGGRRDVVMVLLLYDRLKDSHHNSIISLHVENVSVGLYSLYPFTSSFRRSFNKTWYVCIYIYIYMYIYIYIYIYIYQAWGQLLLKVIYYNYNYFVLALLQLQLQLLLKITIPITITITFEM